MTTTDINDYEAITKLIINHYLKGAVSGKGSEIKPTFHE